MGTVYLSFRIRVNVRLGCYPKTNTRKGKQMTVDLHTSGLDAVSKT